MAGKEKADNYWNSILKEGLLCQLLNEKRPVEYPDYFDRDLFKRGQDFIRQNVFAIFIGQVSGILTMLTLKCSLDGIKLTTTRSMFSTEALNFHLKVMKQAFEIYESPADGPNCRKALKKLKELYLTSLDQAIVSQRDMALCQFAFCGYVLCRPRLLGIDPVVNADNLEGFNHFWRVVGHCIGLDDSFNLCSSSAAETTERVRVMTSRLIGPAFIQHSNTHERIILDFVDIFWYYNPLITANSIRFLSNRLAGVPGHYLTEEERRQDLQTIDEHRPYLGSYFNKLKAHCELYSPRSFAFGRLIPLLDKTVIIFVVFVHEKYLKSKYWRWLCNRLIWIGRFCIRQLSFMAIGLGFKEYSYVNFWIKRRTLQMKLRSTTINRPRKVAGKSQLNSRDSSQETGLT